MYLMGLWGIYACIQADSWMIKYRLVTTDHRVFDYKKVHLSSMPQAKSSSIIYKF